MNIEVLKDYVNKGQISVGIEFGSTRIKTVAIDPSCNTVATGSYEWENQYKNGYWTYSMNDVWIGIQKSYNEMYQKIKNLCGTSITHLSSLGISGMMHGYLAFDENDDLLVSFRTWRNNNANKAAELLRNDFNVNIPERWSIAQLYQSALNNETHVSKVSYMTTLAGYVHWYLTDKKVLGIGDASGMFPIDTDKKVFRQDLLERFNTLFQQLGYQQDIKNILPEVIVSGESAGYLTETGAKLIDPNGQLNSGCPMCAPESDAATGMVATNSVAPKTGNVSAGTSIFSMIVLEQSIKNVYPEVDIVTTPDGYDVAMIHANNCTSDINAWVSLFEDVFRIMGVKYDKNELFTKLFESAFNGDDDLGNLLSYGYISGEFITDVKQGYPLFLRHVDSEFNIENFMKTHIYSAFSTLKIGIDLLKEKENIQIDSMVGHGGIFKTEQVAQSFLAAALESPVSVMKTASEGGAWGIAVLARYLVEKQHFNLSDYLDRYAFNNSEQLTLEPNENDVKSFKKYIQRFKASLPLEQQIDDQT
ncbi:ATPase [Staphylococcus arlettae]|uniref:xylulokinase n=1 Tax=Staphylococcus arlettae TaxID=29378 RepID=UPI000D19D001|nr:FGGY-family carbohydrate kinase [Staphylococcus arlettae]MCD8841092.1 ATPase [Staphylococcus arlettae]MCD8849413.1 ATPase [Staphylococcus arlettae]MEB6066494.1 FGGY-family carbohydrate kinase [Staphylococcus arlettae]PTH23020.1 ATPase [Staphylococcus arlettae]PTH23674.1 ATPase [Staphylococcus arlettae]